MSNDTNLGVGSVYDTPEEEEIKSLEYKIYKQKLRAKELQAENAALREKIASMEQEWLDDRNDMLAKVEALQAENVTLWAALSELAALVLGECPSLLDEDSGGNSRLAIEIEDLLKL